MIPQMTAPCESSFDEKKLRNVLRRIKPSLSNENDVKYRFFSTAHSLIVDVERAKIDELFEDEVM